MSGRSSSAIEARCPAASAASYVARASARSRNSASTVRPSASIRRPVTAARAGSGKTYVASSATSCGLRKSSVSTVRATRPVMVACASIRSSGRFPRSVRRVPSPPSSVGCRSSSECIVVIAVMSGLQVLAERSIAPGSHRLLTCDFGANGRLDGG